VEFVVATLVVVGFIAIIARFAPRDDAGRARMPGIIDQSIAMWALRGVMHRPLGARTNDVAAAAGSQPRSAIGRTTPATSGVADGAGPAPAASARYVASAARLQALGIHPSRPSSSESAEQPRAASSVSGARVEPRRRWRAAPSGATERRLAAIAAAAILAVAALALGAGLLAGEPGGKVLGETGQPALNVASSASASDVATQPSAALVSPSPSPSAQTPIASVRPTASPNPTRTPTPAQTRSPSPTSRPAATPPPAPIAGFSFVVSGTTVTFTDESTGTGLTYSWDFGDASTSSLRDPVHPYAAAGTRYVVKLTIADALGRSALDSQVVPVP
jgi:hypothetical protein